MVVMGWPATVPTCVMQERTPWPPTSTVQAPQTPIPHPYLVPSRFKMSRSTQRRGVSGGTSTVAATLFTVNLIGICLLHNPVRGKRIVDAHRSEIAVYQTYDLECHCVG